MCLVLLITRKSQLFMIIEVCLKRIWFKRNRLCYCSLLDSGSLKIGTAIICSRKVSPESGGALISFCYFMIINFSQARLPVSSAELLPNKFSQLNSLSLRDWVVFDCGFRTHLQFYVIRKLISHGCFVIKGPRSKGKWV